MLYVEILLPAAQTRIGTLLTDFPPHHQEQGN
jgi:hypothetical protein